MLGTESGMQSLVDGLFSQDISVRINAIRKIKHLIIGNRSKKSSFMMMGVVPRLVSLLNEEACASNPDLIREAIITIGSFAHGTAENVDAVVSSHPLPFLSHYLLHPSSSVVACSLKTLRTLYTCGHSPPDADALFQDLSISRKLVALLSEPHPLAQCAALVLAKACQSRDHQNLLCAHGIIDQLTPNLSSPVAKLVQATLLCLASVVHSNRTSAHLVASASCKSHSLISTVLKILSSCHGNESKLAAAKCLTFLYGAGTIDSSSSTITLKVLPSLVRLSQSDVAIATRTEAISTLAYLTEKELSLQELAADSDHLIPTLVEYLCSPPDPAGDLVQECHMEEYEALCTSVLLCLACLAAKREEIRCKVTSERKMAKQLTIALNGENMALKMAAVRCLLSLSRSTKLLRTCLFDQECYKSLPPLLLLEEVKCLQVSTAALSNLLLPFSPSREKLVEKGVLQVLGGLVEHEDHVIKLNSLWGLMNAADGCGYEVAKQVLAAISYEKLIRLLCPSSPSGVVIKTLGILVNLTQSEHSDFSLVGGDVMLKEEGLELVVAMENLLSNYPSSDVTEQCVCVLINMSNASEKTRNVLVGREVLLQCVCELLRSSDSLHVLMAAVEFIKNLVSSDKDGHIHRQNCLKEYGANFALQKLEKKEYRRLQIQVAETLEFFSM